MQAQVPVIGQSGQYGIGSTANAYLQCIAIIDSLDDLLGNLYVHRGRRVRYGFNQRLGRKGSETAGEV